MDVVRVPVPSGTTAAGEPTNAYLVGRDPALLVDPAGRTADLDAAVAERGVGHVLVTHTHRDHVVGVAAYAQETGATVWAHRGYRERFREATGREPDRLLKDDATISLGDEQVSILSTPGHAPDHLSVVLPDDSILCGDLAVSEGSVTVGAPEGNVEDYLETLRRLRDRGPPRLYPGHGPVIDDPDATLERLIEHRLDRERRVLAAVEDGAETVDAILDAAYEKELSGVRDLARATVVAHLEKLAAEGRVAWDGDRAGVP
ncbi:MAG: MBL fold metallo-hydrolase [Halanaeroarchaeum sp.]